MFKKYQSLPKKIEAVRFTNKYKNSILNSLTGQSYPDFESGKPVIKVKTVHGEIAIVRLGDWIAKDAELGTYYPIKHEIFKKGYIEE